MSNVADETPSFDVSIFNGYEKAAVLLLSLTEKDAAELIRDLEPSQVQRLGETMTKIENLNQEKATAVHKAFLECIHQYTNIGMASESFVRNTLVAALGRDKASNMVDQILLETGPKGLDTLKWMDPRQVASLILHEHPQIQTIILSYLDAEQAAKVLAEFSEREAFNIMVRIATLEDIQPSALHELNEIMEKQFAGHSSGQVAKMGGLKAAANIMNYMDNTLEVSLMSQITDHDGDMATKIQDLMFLFENLIDLDDRGMQLVLKEIPQDVLLKAIKGADEPLRDKFYNNMSKRAAELLKDDLDAMGPTRVSDVEAAQKEIITIARRLAENGEIMLGASGSEQFV